MRSSPWLRRSTVSIAFIAIGLVSINDAHAADKDCMDAASRGQEVRDQGHLLESRGYFQKCVQSDCPTPIPTYCGDWLSDVARKIPTLVIRVVDGDGRDVIDATVSVDDQPIVLDGRAVEVDPGKHRIRIVRPGSKPLELEIIAAQGEKDRIILGKLVAEEPPRPPPPITAPPPEPSAQREVPPVTWISWGVGAAGLASFAIFGIKARLDYDSYESSCGQRCTVSARDSVATTVTTADVSLVVGLVGVAVGTVAFLLHSKSTAAAPSTVATSVAR